MSYKIAVASSDGVHIDETFGSAKSFLIFEVDQESYEKKGERNAVVEDVENSEQVKSTKSNVQDAQNGCSSSGGCNSGGCSGGSGKGGCSGGGNASVKVGLIEDCRCVVCKKIGFNIQKQLEKKAIISFDVSCTVEEALKKITAYLYKVDHHQSLRNSSKE